MKFDYEALLVWQNSRAGARIGFTRIYLSEENFIKFFCWRTKKFHYPDKNIQCFLKWGSDRPSNPSGVRCPDIACWPTHAIICEMLMKEPTKKCINLFIKAITSLTIFNGCNMGEGLAILIIKLIEPSVILWSLDFSGQLTWRKYR